MFSENWQNFLKNYKSNRMMLTLRRGLFYFVVFRYASTSESRSRLSSTLFLWFNVAWNGNSLL